MKEVLIKRDQYLDKLRPFVGSKLIKVITGVRRSGKSKILELSIEELKANGVSEDNILLLNFESEKNAGIRDKAALSEYIRDWEVKTEGKTYIFLDEIQEVAEWEKCVRALPLDYDADVYITGSNAQLLSGELATMLAGRCITIEVFPFSFRETYDFLRTQSDITEEQAFDKYLEYGGMPNTLFFGYGTVPCMDYLNTIYSQIYLKDIIERYKIRDPVLLERLMRYVLSEIGNTFSSKSISDYLKSQKIKASVPTINGYLDDMVQSMLFEKILRNDLEGKKILDTDEKYYVVDHGMRQCVLMNNGKNINRVYENLVCLELLRRGFSVTVGRTKSGREIDFVAERPGGTKEYYQVCYYLTDEDTVKREFSSLLEIRDNYPKYVISGDTVDRSSDGIIHKNIIGFLMGR